MSGYSRAFLLRNAARMSVDDAARKLGVSSATIRNWEKSGSPGPKTGMLIALEALANDAGILRAAPEKSTFKFIDLFAGIGGLRQAFQSAGGQCVFTSEWNKFAIQTYVSNFGCCHPIVGDITDVAAENVPDHDILLAGFHCQPFSLAGVSKKNSLGRKHGFEDETQGTLFFDVARIISEKKPSAFVLENVKNLISHDKGNTFKVIMKTLEESLGYRVTYKVMDSRPWVPQKRERIVIVGVRGGHSFNFDTVAVPEQGPRMGSILHDPENPETWDEVYAPGGNVDAFALTDNLWKYLQDYAAKHAEKGNGFGYGLVSADSVSRTISARYHKDGSEILVARDNGNPRRLTPRECARLMGIDNPSVPPLHIPVSNSQSWKQFGNSVVTPMFGAVAKALVSHLRIDDYSYTSNSVAA